MIKISECNHIRIRDQNAYHVNVELFIKYIEDQYKIDFRSLPQWKELVKRLHVMTTDYKCKIQGANERKFQIINKIFTESTRFSPFELTECLARTFEKWQNLSKLKKKTSLILNSPKIGSLSQTKLSAEEISIDTFSLHPNTEIFETDNVNVEPSKAAADTNTKPIEIESHLPVTICTNLHKLISPIKSDDNILVDMNITSELPLLSEKESKEWMSLRPSSAVVCYPAEIAITKKSCDEQTIKFSVKNFTTNYMYIRFVCLTDTSSFKRGKIIPATPRKLYKGIAITFKFTFKLLEETDNVASALFFKVGEKIYNGAPVESLCIPVLSKFKEFNKVTVQPEAVYIPATYLWHMRRDTGFPSTKVKVSNKDNRSYHLHIVKQSINIARDFNESIKSVEVVTPNTESLFERIEDQQLETDSKFISTTDQVEVEETESVLILNSIVLTVSDIIDTALDSFVFDKMYYFLKPGCHENINVNLSKPSHIGSHHAFYDFKFYDTFSDDFIGTRTVKLFGEVRPHPIQIEPVMLDMSNSPVTHGFCEDDIIIYNNHNLWPVTIRIKLTSKMKKLFSVTPLEAIIHAQSRKKFNIKLCTKDPLEEKMEYLVHFTFKIKVIGEKSVFKNVPPFYYEIVAPCATLFRKVYNEKYFKEEE